MQTESDPQPEARDIEGRLMEFIRNELLGPEGRVGREDDLLSGELLDSVAVLRLAAFVEQEFSILMQPSDFVVENFQNVAVLTDYVRRSRQRAG